jgi:5-methylcytosine-specific restriction endonuclease McrA
MSQNKKLVCSRCNEEKPTFMFYLNKLSKTGFRSECKTCTTEYKKKPDQRRFYAKVRRANNPDKHKGYAEARARRAGVESEPYTVNQVISLFGSTCHLCGLEIDLLAPRKVGSAGWESGLHLDHVKPIALGGSDTINNIRPSHGICNLRKGISIYGK